MGQYYYPVNMDKKQYLFSHDYGDGLKLMEHSYIGNQLVNAVSNLLIPGGDWYKCRLVWAGDYADKEDGLVNKDGEPTNWNGFVHDNGTRIQPPSTKLADRFRYVLNHDKKLFVNLTKIPEIENSPGFRIHPLPLLTCEGNGRGGGDFHGEDMWLGDWARDSISIEESIPEGFEEHDVAFKEDY